MYHMCIVPRVLSTCGIRFWHAVYPHFSGVLGKVREFFCFFFVLIQKHVSDLLVIISIIVHI